MAEVKQVVTPLACPFCGSDQLRAVKIEDENVYMLECVVCDAQGPLADNHVLALRRWNSRKG